jgi:hypothetical protein
MRRTVRLARLPHLFESIFLFFVLGAAHAQCDPGDILVGEDDDNYYCRRKSEYQGSVAERAGTRFCVARRTLAADQSAIRALGFATDTERFEMFQRVSREQKAELQHKVLDVLFDQGLEATSVAVKSAQSLNPWNVNNAVKMLKEKRFGNAKVIAALRRIALTKDKPAMAAAYREFADVAKAAKEGWSTGSGMASDANNAELRLLVGALKLMQGNPGLGTAVTAAELGESFAYLVYVSGRVDELTRSTDDKLLRLDTLSQRLKGDVEALKASRRQWRQAMGIAGGEPTCGP